MKKLNRAFMSFFISVFAPASLSAQYNSYYPTPQINYNIYNNYNGYKSPTRYNFAQNQQTQSQYTNINNEIDYGTEYFLSLSGSKNKFTGSGLTGKTGTLPLNDESNGLGDTKTLTVGFGVMNNRKYNLEVNYNYIHGLNYDKTSYSHNQFCGPNIEENPEFNADCTDENEVEGGKINSSSLLLNLNIPFTDILKGSWFDGLFTPYITGGIGLAFNKIDDYTVIDEFGKGELPKYTDGIPTSPTNENLAGVYTADGKIQHFGDHTYGFGYNFGTGLSFNIDKKTVLDLYYKISQHGTIKSKDKVYYSYEEFDIVDATQNLNTGTFEGQTIQDYCTPQAIGEGFEFNEDTGWCERSNGITEGYETKMQETGNISNTEIGVKLKLIF